MTQNTGIDRRFEDDLTEVYLSSGLAVVHDKVENKYFQTTYDRIPDEILESTRPVQSKVSKEFAYGFLLVGLVLLVGNLSYSLTTSSSPTPAFLLWFIPYMLVSVVIHELAHIVALKAFGRKHDTVGFKLHYVILPAFFVRMNQSVLLTRNERLVVHAAGIWVNFAVNTVLIIVNGALIHSDNLKSALIFAIVSLLYNAIPLLGSDGYRVLLALVHVNELKERKSNPRWIRVVKTLSWVLVVVYGLHITIGMYMEIIGI